MTAHELYNYIKENFSDERKCISAIEQEYDLRRLEGTIIDEITKGNRFININHHHPITLEGESKKYGEVPEILGGNLPFSDKPFSDNEQKIEEL